MHYSNSHTDLAPASCFLTETIFRKSANKWHYANLVIYFSEPCSLYPDLCFFCDHSCQLITITEIAFYTNLTFQLRPLDYP